MRSASRPKWWSRSRTTTRSVEVERKLFPSYVLVKMIMTDDSWYVVRNIRGVTGFVGPGSKPVPLTEDEVERFGRGEPARSRSTTPWATACSIGGYLEGFMGIVEAH